MFGYGRAPDKVRKETVAKMGESFDALAMAAEASKTTYEDQERTIATLTTATAELTTTNRKLTDKMVTLAEKLTAATETGGQDGSVPPGFDRDANQTGSAANSDDVFVPTRKLKKGKKTLEFFVSKQKCGHYGQLTTHLPELCNENPRREAINSVGVNCSKTAF